MSIAASSSPFDGHAGPVPSPAAVSTKLYPPRVRATFVARAQPVVLLTGNPDRRLTIVCAPAGYGKSTLVAQWLEEVAIPSAWVTLEASDNDPLTYFTLIVATLRAV